MTKRGDLLALAVALSGGDEVTLGPTDSAMCAEALKFYANEQSKAGMVKAMKIPAMIAAALLGTVALGGSSAVIGQANMKVSTMGLSDVPVEHFATVVRRHVRPVPYSTPASLAIQRFATSFPFVDG